MTTRRRTSARKSAKAASATVKKSTPVVTSHVVRVNKVTQPRMIMTESTTASKIRPEKPNLSMKDYRDDIKVRWEIHLWETQELWKDMVKGYNIVQPFVVKTIDYVKESYDRAFNETEGQKAN